MKAVCDGENEKVEELLLKNEISVISKVGFIPGKLFQGKRKCNYFS